MSRGGKATAAWRGIGTAVLVLAATAVRTAASDEVAFEADRIRDDRDSGRVELSGHVLVRYRDVEIKAAHVTYDRAGGLLIAEARDDTAGGAAGRPEFVRGTERFTADRMVYDLRADRGRVWGGRAVSQDRYHIRGQHVLLDSLRNVYLRDISLTTCDRNDAHYRFLAGRLKVIEDDKAVARGVTFELGPVPVFWFPFYVFPLRKGRHSGILTPSVGSSSRDGLVVSNLGYYLAPSDYWDAALRTTLRERGGLLAETAFAYAVRRRMNGNVDVAYDAYTSPSGGATRSGRLNLNHYQRLSPTANVRASGTFASSRSFDQRNSNNLYDYLNRQLRSSLSVDKHWTDTDRSLDGSVTFLRDLDSGRNDYRGFPRLSLRQGRRRFFGARDPRAAAQGQAWYRAFYYSLSGDLDHTFASEVDSVGTGGWHDRDLSFGGNLSVSSQHRPFGWIELSPSFSTAQRVSRNDIDRPTRTESYTGRVSTGTTLYGFFGPRLGSLRGVRHRFQPRVDFGYTQSAAVDSGTFGFGGTRDVAPARRTLDVSVTNAFDAKTEGAEGRLRRFTFLSASTSAGIDFDALPRRLRPLRTVVSVKPGQRLDVRLNTTHDFYDEAGRFERWPRLSNLSVTTSVRLQGSGGPVLDDPFSSGLQPYGTSDFGFERDLARSVTRAEDPWRLSLSHHYESIRGLSGTSRTSWLKLDAGLSPSPSWRFDYGINVDLVNPDVTAQSMSVYRTLHCWEARLSVTPNGYNRGFSGRVNIRQIPQFGFTHRQGRQ